MRKIVVTAVAVMVAAAGLSACSSSGGKTGTANPYGLVDAGVIHAAADSEQPPWSSVQTNGKLQGVAIAIADEAAKRLGLKIDYKSTDVTGVVQGLTAGQYDLGVMALSVTPERQKSIDFTKFIGTSDDNVLTTTSSTISTVADLDGKRVGVLTGSAQADYLTASLPKANAVKFANGNAEMLALLSGGVSGVLIGTGDATEYLKQYSGKIKAAVSIVTGNGAAMGVRKNEPKLTAAMNKEIAAMIKDGTFVKFFKQYRADDPPTVGLFKVWPNLKSQMQAAYPGTDFS